MIIFHKFEHSFLLISSTKQVKNNWERNYMLHSYHFMQFWYKPLLYPPKNLGKRAQTAESTKKW